MFQDSSSVSYQMTHNVSNTVTSAHFHGIGLSGSNQGVLTSIDVSGGMHTYSGVWSISNSTVIDALTGLSMTMYGQNVVYVNIHTNVYASGEIRGIIFMFVHPYVIFILIFPYFLIACFASFFINFLILGIDFQTFYSFSR